MEDQAVPAAAALSYYTLFSLAPLLSSSSPSPDSPSVEMRHKIESSKLSRAWLGEKAQRRSRQSFKMRAVSPILAFLSTMLGLIILLVGAGGVVGQLQTSLNTIWGVTPKAGRDIWGFVRQRFISLAWC